jgi:hypothetical protein
LDSSITWTAEEFICANKVNRSLIMITLRKPLSSSQKGISELAKATDNVLLRWIEHDVAPG